MSKKILGLDLGTNSIGWALLEEKAGKPCKIIDLGSRIFIKAVEEKTPTPKNVKRRDARLARRVNQRRNRRKQRMLNYLVKLDLLPHELQGNTQPEIILNGLGDPYALRAKALDNPLSVHELGRVFLHLVQRRGFLSSKKTLLGDMVDDPDVKEVLEKTDEFEVKSSETSKEETAFKKDISELRNTIQQSGCRTLGEYLSTLDSHACKRNRSREGGHLRTDRQMYMDELDEIWAKQRQYHKMLTDDVKQEIENIIFYQRPLKLRSDRVGKCLLEPKRKRANIARLEYQRFRYLQDINNLKYFDFYHDNWVSLDKEERTKLIELFERKANPTFKTDIRNVLGLDKGTEFNLDQENRKLKGNITAYEIRTVFPGWDKLSNDQQHELVEDLMTIRKKSALKKRLLSHWSFDKKTAIKLCLLEFEPGYGNHSVKAINRMMPYLVDGQRYDEARVSADYGYERKDVEITGCLGQPPEIPNPIVQKALYELRRLTNAVISEYGKPDAIRVEMARDLEMNTKKYKAFIKQQNANTKANVEAVEKYREIAQTSPHLKLSKYPSRADKIRYRLWKDQDQRCAYSNKAISMTALFSAEIDVDHILPYSESLDDSYMNKVVCYSGENRYKGQRTPIDAYGGNEEKWTQITQSIKHWDKCLKSKRDRFYLKGDDLVKRDFISSQLNDTRYISRIALNYLEQLGADITVSKGNTTAWARYQWGLNNLLSTGDEKDRADHRHHAIDAVVIACIDRRFYKALVGIAKDLERKHTRLNIKDIHFDPPWESFRNDLRDRLNNIVVSHTPQRKLNGALHKETGVGFIENVGTVYRVDLDGSFKAAQLKKVIDDDVRELITRHLKKYGNDPKKAFAEGVHVYHKDGKTPIKRVRIVQSNTDLVNLENSKYGIRDKSGNVFKWLAYGNLHHVEIFKNKSNGKIISNFITTMEAHHRAKGIGMPRQSIVNHNHGPNDELLMVLYINDLVIVEIEGAIRLYRVQKLEQPGVLQLRQNNAATLDNPEEGIRKSISTLVRDFRMKKSRVNCIGKIIV